MHQVRLTAVVAMTEGRQVIGNSGKMLWRIPSDFERFKRITTQAGIMIMGRKTYQSILAHTGHPLTERYHIVLSRHGDIFEDGVVGTVKTVDQALELAELRGPEACVIGGGEIYRLFLPFTARIKATWVDANHLEGDASFPKIDPMVWTSSQRIPMGRWHTRDQHPTAFEIFERV